jgi:uncharacterized protein (TIRG00374 family)
MKRRAALALAIAGTAAYVAVLAWVDRRNAIFDQLPRLAWLLPVLMTFSLASYSVRYLRWHWLLRRHNHVTPWLHGWLAYLSGFAFTASPGKLGELVRIRYLLPYGVPPATVLAAFVFERALDLVTLLLLAALAVQDGGLFAMLAFVVAAACVAIAWFARHPGVLRSVAARLRRMGLVLPARLARTLQHGLAGCRRWANPPDMGVSFLLGVLAWTITSAAFVWLLLQLGVALPFLSALAVYPTAMLAGAASMVPGGIGTTEAMTVLLLVTRDVPVAVATLAAIAIRLSGLWFAIGCGLLSAAVLERRMAR